MKTKLLKLKRRHPFWFNLFYQDEINRRRMACRFKKISSITIRMLGKKADECWGWDIDRDVYDACIIASHTILEFQNRISNGPI